MASWADHCAAVWFNAVLAAFLVTGFATLAMIQCRQPARRRAWGRLGLLASFAVVPLVVLNPLPRVDLKHPTSALWGRSARTGSAGIQDNLGSGSVDGVPGATGDQGIPLDAAPHDASWANVFGRGMLVGYGIGMGVGLSRLTVGLMGTRYFVRRARRASGRTDTLLGSLPFARSESRRPCVLTSELVTRPVLVGVLRPVILVPSDFDQPKAEAQLRLGLLHELAHAEMNDHRFGFLAALAHTCWFFLPQVWWIRNQLRLDAEFLADHRAVGHYGTSFRYAESLVGLALDPSAMATAGNGARAGRAVTRTGTSAAPQRIGGLASALLQRVQMLLKCPFEVEEHPPRFWTLGVGVVLVVVTLASSSLTIRDPHPQRVSLASASVGEAAKAFHLAELVIAPNLADSRPFDLRYPLPEQFRLVCEILAAPAELDRLEILGYPLGPTRQPNRARDQAGGDAWRRVEITRDPGGLEAVHVDGEQVGVTRRPGRPAAWLTIKPIPSKTTRLRNLHLTW